MATFTQTQSGNINDGATFGNASPGVEGTDYPDITNGGDLVVTANGYTLTFNVDAILGDKTSAVGHAITITGASAVSFGTVVLNDTVSLTLRGYNVTTATMLYINRYGLFDPAPGATILGDVPSDFGSIILNKGRFEAIGTAAKPITFSVPAASVDWSSAVAAQNATCSPYDNTAKIAVGMAGSPLIANAAGTGLGSFGDTSITINSSSASLDTEVATLAEVTGAGKYCVDYDIGVFYFYTASFTGMTLNLTYTKLDKTAATWKGWGILSNGATTSNTCLLDYCTLQYMGAAGNGVLSGSVRQSAPVNFVSHQTTDATRLAYLKRSTLRYGFRYALFHGSTGASGDPILCDSNTFNDGSGGGTWDGLSCYASSGSYLTVSNNDFNTRGTGVDLANIASDVDHLSITDNAGVCALSFVAGGLTARTPWQAKNDAVTSPSTPDLSVSGNVILGISGAVDARFVCVSGTSGHPAIVEDNTFSRCWRLGHLLGSYVTFRRNRFLNTYHHGFTGSQWDDYYCTDTTFENNLFYTDLIVTGEAAIALGYNHRCIHNNVVIRNNTCIGFADGLVDFNDAADSNGPSTFTNIRIVNNIVSSGAYAFANYTSATMPQVRHIVECDYNLSNGQATAYALNHDNTANATGFYRSAAKYNRETSATRNLPMVALFDASYTSAETAHDLVYTVNTLGQDHTLIWSSGTPVQLIYDYGTSAGEGLRTVAVAGKSAWNTNNNLVRTNWMWVVSGTGSGQARQILWATTNTAYSATVAAGGSGYSLNQYIRLFAGTMETPAARGIFQITGVSGDAVTSVKVVSGGTYSAPPADAAATTRLTGTTGASCTLNILWAPGLLFTPDLSTDLDTTSVIAIVDGEVQLDDGAGGTVRAGLYLPDPANFLTAVQIPTTTQTDTGITVTVDKTVTSAPAFVATGDVDLAAYYQLASDSPAIDAGTSDDAADADYWGTSRPVGDADDIGFFEYEEVESGLIYTQTNTSSAINSTQLLNRNSIIIGNGGAFFPEYGNFFIGVGFGQIVELYNDRFFGRGYYRRDRSSKND
jgi:hypothetical protein